MSGLNFLQIRILNICAISSHSEREIATSLDAELADVINATRPLQKEKLLESKKTDNGITYYFTTKLGRDQLKHGI